MRVMLIEPPFYRLFHKNYSCDAYPLSLGYLSAAVLYETRWEVICYNADFVPNPTEQTIRHLTGDGYLQYVRMLNDPAGAIWQEVKQKIAEFCPDVVGISSKSQNYKSATRVAELAKHVRPQILVVVGGPHATMVQEAALECQHIDVVVRGEGERTLVELLRAVENERGMAGIEGTIYRDGANIVKNSPRPLITDLDALAFPNSATARVLHDYDKYSLNHFQNIFATRGCPFFCLFCGSRETWGRHVRFRSPQNVAQEIRTLQKQGINAFHFVDDTFGVNKRYLKELCATIQVQCPGIKWSCTFHVALVDHETLADMKAAGCEAIYLGLESGNDEVLHAIRKTSSVAEARAACRTIRQSGIYLSVFFIVGLPMDTEQSLKDTFKFMMEVEADSIIYSIFTPYPGTEMFELCRQKGLIPENYDCSLYNHTSPANSFCSAVSHERLREIATDIERAVDRWNRRQRLRRGFSLAGLKRLRKMGLAKVLRLGFSVLMKKF